jgi:hypothetical protein
LTDVCPKSNVNQERRLIHTQFVTLACLVKQDTEKNNI